MHRKSAGIFCLQPIMQPMRGGIEGEYYQHRDGNKLLLFFQDGARRSVGRALTPAPPKATARHHRRDDTVCAPG
jgi:hypothetical protein